MREVAMAALANYHLRAKKIELLNHYHNTSFRVLIQASPHNKPVNYVLRIHRPEYQTIDSIKSELNWLHRLHALGIEVPEPKTTKQGSEIVTAQVGGILPRTCVLFHWIEGIKRYSSLNHERMRRLGTLVGLVHQHASEISDLEKFTRPTWDWHYLSGQFFPGINLNKYPAYFHARSKTILRKSAVKIQNILRDIGKSERTFGLIHADLSYQNTLFKREKIALIDFDNCGWGYYLYDLAVILANVRYHPNYDALESGLIIGYSFKRQLPAEYPIILTGLMAANIYSHTMWLALNIDNPVFGRLAKNEIQLHLFELNNFIHARELTNGVTIKPAPAIPYNHLLEHLPNGIT